MAAVARLGLGLAAVGRPAYINLGRERDLGEDRGVEAMRRRTHALLDRAWERGIRYVDVARSYGRAEEFLASWLDSRGHRPTVGSKWGYTYTGGWRMDADVHEEKDHSLPTLERQLAESRELLGEHLALYQVHSATLDSGVLDDERVLARLHALAEEGVVVGLTLSGPGQADTLRRALDSGGPFRCVQATWNVLEPSAGPVLADAAEAGWGVIVKEGLANGRLAAGGPLAALAEERGASADALALAAALAQPWAHVVLSGAATPEQLDSNLDALALADGLAPLPDLAEEPERYWETRSGLAWA